jgi:hypothetical protein
MMWLVKPALLWLSARLMANCKVFVMQFIDLKAQFEALEPAIKRRIDRVLGVGCISVEALTLSGGFSAARGWIHFL